MAPPTTMKQLHQSSYQGPGGLRLLIQRVPGRQISRLGAAKDSPRAWAPGALGVASRRKGTRFRGQCATCSLTGAGKGLTLPEREEDDGLDHEELEDRAVGAEQLPCGEVEEEEGVEGQADRDVVDDGHVQVATGDAARTGEHPGSDGPF